ncbi:MAG: shikimate dehydrogenase [Candidatus Lokiarchaeota archaeon]|nr:shikimate dehydrogenase [Candidatus Harpocratesius repetitus]
MEISGTTQVVGIIGNPIEHVLSPIMHNAVFDAQNLDWVYIPLQVSQINLKQVVFGLKYSSFRGFNITIPHKVNILPLLDEIEPHARQIGAVNTVKIVDHKLIGKNTDGEGALQSLIDHDFPLKHKKITILGAGGAARAIFYYVFEYSKNICIINRSQSRLSNFLKEIRINTTIKDQTGNISGLLFDEHEIVKKRIEDSDLIINTTPVGMYPKKDQSLILKQWLKPHNAVFDVIYTPIKSKLLKDAEEIGCRILNGIEMLINQGALAFEWWTNQKADKELMKKMIIQFLKQ